MGKSLYIKRLKEKLETQTSVQPLEVVVPIHGPVVTADTVVKSLEKYLGTASATIFHIDIAPNVGDIMYMWVLLCLAISHLSMIVDVVYRVECISKS